MKPKEVSDDKPVRLYGFEIVDHMAHRYAEHLDMLMAEFVERVNGYGLSDADVNELIREQRELHVQELRKCIAALVAFVMSGGRVPTESLH